MTTGRYQKDGPKPQLNDNEIEYFLKEIEDFRQLSESIVDELTGYLGNLPYRAEIALEESGNIEIDPALLMQNGQPEQVGCSCVESGRASAVDGGFDFAIIINADIFFDIVVGDQSDLKVVALYFLLHADKANLV